MTALPTDAKRATEQVKLNEAQAEILNAIVRGESPYDKHIVVLASAWQERDYADPFELEGQGFFNGLRAGMTLMRNLYDQSKTI